MSILPVLTIICFLVPPVIISFRKLWKDKFFLLFGIYGILGALINLSDFLPGLKGPALEQVNVFYNLVDIPYVLLMLHTISRDRWIKKVIHFSVAIYFGFQLYFLAMEGMKYEAMTYTLGFGLVMIIFSILWILLSYLRRMGLQPRHIAFVTVLGALLFSYGSFVVVYIFDYIITGYATGDNLLIYYVSTIVAMLIGSAGMMIRGIHQKHYDGHTVPEVEDQL